MRRSLRNAYLAHEKALRDRAGHTAQALRAISARDCIVYLVPGGAPKDIFRTFSRDTIDLVVLIEQEGRTWGTLHTKYTLSTGR